MSPALVAEAPASPAEPTPAEQADLSWANHPQVRQWQKGFDALLEDIKDKVPDLAKRHETIRKWWEFTCAKLKVKSRQDLISKEDFEKAAKEWYSAVRAADGKMPPEAPVAKVASAPVVAAKPAAAPPPPAATKGPAKPRLAISSGARRDPQRVGIFGTGGAGKSTLASLLPLVGVRPLFLDLNEGSGELNVDRITPREGLDNFDTLRATLQDEELWEPYGAVVIDTMTEAEQLATDWVIKNVPHERNDRVIKNIEDYGFGKGYRHIYNAMNLLFQDLDAHVRAGRHVILICHECTAKVPNPSGEDFIRYEPRLLSPKSGEGSVRHRLKEWCGHLFFVGYDMFSKDGKATGKGSRTIYTQEQPTHWAKSRTVREPVLYKDGDPRLWQLAFQLNTTTQGGK